MQRLAIVALSILLCILTACHHHMDVQQGNIISSGAVQQLKTGMTREQVENILGSPVLTQSFTDRLTYIYTWKTDSQPFQEQSVTIYFDNGRLTSYKSKL